MANLNKVMLIGRLTRKPEPIMVRGVVQGAKFGFAVNNRKYNQDKQDWEDVPVFLDVEIWNRGEGGKQADRALESLRGPDREAGIKASQVFLEGHLKMDTWTDPPEKGGAKRSKLVVVVDNFQYLDPATTGTGGGGMGERGPRATQAPPRSQRTSGYAGYDDDADVGAPPARQASGGGGAGTDDEIPF